MRIFILTFSLLIHTIVFAKEEGNATLYADPVSDATTVAACAVGGAVLGLSTLPFTEEPGDHLKNILVGGAIGLIAGVAFVAYFQAAKTQSQVYSSMVTTNSLEFDTNERMRWHQKSFSSFNKNKTNQFGNLSYSFSF